MSIKIKNESKTHSLKELPYWSDVMNTSLNIIRLMIEERFLFSVGKGEAKIYNDAVINLITSSATSLQKFIDREDIGFRNWKRDKKGKLIFEEAYFIQK